MTGPEQALEQARAAAAAMRARGAYSENSAHDPLIADREDPSQKLFEWAMLEPDVRNVRSTRRFGAPITALKHALLRLLFQYHQELISEQTRFNVSAAGYVRLLEERIEELERKVTAGGRCAPGSQPGERPR